MKLLNIKDDEGASQELEENEILAEDDGDDRITVQETSYEGNEEWKGTG